MLPDLLEVALHVVQVLEGNGVTYLIGGSLASAHFGIPRSTLGVDLYFCSPEDIILHKLDWYRQGGGLSDRQWNDVLGVL